MTSVPGLEVFGKSRGEYTLPCGAVIGGVVHKDVILRELTGVEEDLLDDINISVTERISNVLTACIEKLGTIEDKALIKAAVSDTLGDKGLPLTAADRIAALLFLRRVSLGDIYRFESKCTDCGHVNKNRHVDLRELEIKSMPDATKRRVEVTLPRSGKKAVMKVVCAGGENKVAKLKPTQKDLKTYAILARLESFDGKLIGDTQADVDLIKKLPHADRSELINVYQIMEGNVDTMVQLTCKKCGSEYETPIDFGSFFFTGQTEKLAQSELKWV